MSARLHPDDLAALADLVAQRVVAVLTESRPGPVLLTAAEVARQFGVSAEWVRENADRLGVLRLGDGPRPRLRFDPDVVGAALTARWASERSQVEKPPRRLGRATAPDRERAGEAGLLSSSRSTPRSPRKKRADAAQRLRPGDEERPLAAPEPTRPRSASGAAGRAPRAATERSQHG